MVKADIRKVEASGRSPFRFAFTDFEVAENNRYLYICSRSQDVMLTTPVFPLFAPLWAEC
jgi:hypothetical protein